MRLKFAILAILATIVALAAPASSLAGFYPTNTKFEIKGDANGPKITTSLGSCSLANISGTTPADETTALFVIPTPTPGSCSTGASMTLGGTWLMEDAGQTGVAGINNVILYAALTLKYASLPGCKLSGSTFLGGSFLNAPGGGPLSQYHAESAGTLAWQNDGGTCALAGQNETVRFEDTQTNGSIRYSAFATVVGPTYPTVVVK